MIRLNAFIYLLILSSLFLSCNKSGNNKQGDVIARVGESFLYKGDVKRLVKEGMSKSDSTLIIDRYINRWARREIILQKAELNLSAEEANFNRLIEEYRVGLITSAYRQKLVSQYLDTIITSDELNEFYEVNKSNFILNNDLVMLKYVVFPINISEKKSIIKMIKSNKQEDFLKLEALCYQFSSRFSISDSVWMPLNELKMQIPELKKIKNNRLLKKDSFIELQDSLNLYLTLVLNVKRKNDIAPLSFVDERIHNIIMNKRKLELMRTMEDQLMEDAIKNTQFETYK